MVSFTSLFLMAFVCLPMHACNARHYFRFLDQRLFHAHAFLSASAKVGEKVMYKMEMESADEANIARKSRAGGAINQEAVTETSSGYFSIKPLVSVSRRGPSKRHNHEHPGFLSDYSQPATRPPSHN